MDKTQTVGKPRFSCETRWDIAKPWGPPTSPRRTLLGRESSVPLYAFS
jgi:hypothetical protein